MLEILKIQNETAIINWNAFASGVSSICPFSFNPSLAVFYKNHFNWKTYYFLIYQNGEIRALLPIINTGKKYVSLPHFSYGGFLVSNHKPELDSNKIIHSIINTLQRKNPESGFFKCKLEDIQFDKKTKHKVFIRSLNNYSNVEFIKSDKITSLLSLPKSTVLFSKAINSNLRRKIKKSLKTGVIVKSGGEELLNDFYNVYSRNIYKLKSLNYPKNFFLDLFSSYQNGDIVLFVAYLNDVCVGGGLMASYKGFFENLFFATNIDARKYYVSDLLHWNMINSAIEINSKEKSNKHGVYSFGRSSIQSGVHKFKKHWPVTDYPLYNYPNMLKYNNYNLLPKLWGFLPYCISKPLGTKLIEHIY